VFALPRRAPAESAAAQRRPAGADPGT